MSQGTHASAELEPTGDGVLGRMPTAPRGRLLGLMRRAHHGAGVEILSEGADTPFLGIVERGRIALRLRVPERGERLSFVTIEPGDLLGWSALVPPYRSTAQATTTEDTQILIADAADLRALLELDHEVAAELLPIVLEAVSRRLTSSWHQLIDMFCARSAGPW